MLAVSHLRSPNEVERAGELGGIFPAANEFSDDFSGGGLLEDIDFDDLFVVGFDDGDLLPDLELDSDEILAEFSIGSEDPEAAVVGLSAGDDQEEKMFPKAETAVMKKDGSTSPEAPTTASSSSLESDRGRKTSAVKPKGSHGKRKVKVDWTPELHRRFVQAVEHLGVDKAVPSRILELMGIDCLTRHNIASHLQKYRSHRRHILAREAQAASWSQKRQMYGGSGGSCGGGGVAKRDIKQQPLLAPTMGFPPTPIPSFRPLHVWGHPYMDQPLLHMWPKHHIRPAAPPPWAPHLPLPPLPSYWHTHQFPRGPRDGWVPNPMTRGAPCFPQPMPAAVPGVPPHPFYRPNYGVPPSSNHWSSQLLLDAHQSKESIDAAIGDVLLKPWLPLPLGLKPPSLESVLVELQRQGVAKIPPPCG